MIGKTDQHTDRLCRTLVINQASDLPAVITLATAITTARSPRPYVEREHSCS